MEPMPIRDIAELSFRQLSVLHVLLAERSLTRAAALLDTTQPAISKVLARLRRAFDDPLFVRVGATMQPTPKAVLLAEPLGALLAQAEALGRTPASFEPSSSSRQYRLLVSDVGVLRFLPPLMSALLTEGPQVRLAALPLDMRQFQAQLESGAADIALGAFPRATEGLRRQRLFSEGYLSVVRADHPRLAQVTSRAGFLGERHIIVAAAHAGHGVHAMAEQALAAAIAPERIALSVPSFVGAALAAARSEAIATLPGRLARGFGRDLGLVAFRPPLALPKIEIAQYWHERYHRDPAHRWLRGLVHRTFGGSTGSE
jgi:DNA-binding transcriptional LysR family regulator